MKYNPLLDYRSAHIAWVKKNKNYFCPYYEVFEGLTYENWLITLYYTIRTYARDEMRQLYTQDYPNYAAYLDYKRDLECLDNQMEVMKSMTTIQPHSGLWFVTLGFNHQTYSDSKMLKFVYNLREHDWIKSFKGKFEIHRTNGMHPHMHIRLETDLTKSKIIEKILRSKGGKDLFVGKQSIDVKLYEPHHTDYLNGKKQESKMPSVENDVIYRMEHNIPHFIEK